MNIIKFLPFTFLLLNKEYIIGKSLSINFTILVACILLDLLFYLFLSLVLFLVLPIVVIFVLLSIIILVVIFILSIIGLIMLDLLICLASHN